LQYIVISLRDFVDIFVIICKQRIYKTLQADHN